MGRARLLGCFIAVVSCSSESTPGEMEVLRTQVEVWASDDDDDDPAATGQATPTATADLGDDHEGDEDPRSDRGRRAHDDTRVVADLDKCERFRVKIDEHGKRRYQRIRRPWTKRDQEKFASLVSLVAREMGAEPRLIRTWALRESSYRPHALHLLNPDIEAATSAWQRLYYSPHEEAELEAVLASTSKQDRRYWEAKARLSRIQTFRDNDFLDERVEFELIEPDGTVSSGTEPAWAFGYGPFGMNPAYFVPVWDATAPPWVFCDEDGLIAIITAVWAARTSQRDCERQGFGGSYAVVDRRFGQGHCSEVGPEANFRTRAHRMGIDPDARAKLGTKWRRTETDRSEILAHMRTRAIEAGLLAARAEAGT